MATIKSKNGYREIQFFDKARKRKSYYAGKITKRDAERIANRIEAIIACQIQGIAITDSDLNKWIGELKDSSHAKLAKLGVVVARERANSTPDLKTWSDRYISKHAGKPATIKQIRLTAKQLNEIIGGEKLLSDITPGDAQDFRRELESRGLATNTIRRRIGRSREIFGAAIKHRLINENPFAGEAYTVEANEERMVFVPHDVIDQLLHELKCEDLKIIVALARYAGMRRHECLTQRWEDVDLVSGKMIIRSDKTPPIRVCPIFPELRPHLMRAREMAPEGAAFLQNRYHAKGNPITTLKKKVIEAGLKPWPKLLQNLRASRETELMAKYPIKDVTGWIGNSPQIAMKHYAMTLTDSFSRAISEGATPQITPQSVQNRAVHGQTSGVSKERVNSVSPVKDAISLDLSVLADLGLLPSSAPTRTRT